MKIFTILLVCLIVSVVFYLLAIMPRMFRKPDMTPLQDWLYAHRGLHDNETDAPENSLKAFEKAVDAGFGIELDIQLTKDAIPVVFHDDTLKRICGEEGKVADHTYEELQQFTLCNSQERIPKLEDVLQMVNGKVPLIVEFKVEEMDLSLCPIADELLKDYQGVYCMESFNPLVVWWYRRKRPEIIRGQLSQAFLREEEYRGKLYFALQHLLMNFLSKPDFVAYNHKHHNMLSRRLCRSLYKNTAVAWTIKSEQELAEAGKYFDLFIFDSFMPRCDKKEQ